MNKEKEEFQKNTENENNENQNNEQKAEEVAEEELNNSKDDSKKEDVKLELTREELVEELREKNEKIEELDAEVDDLLSRLQRLQADFVNYRKRSQREKSEMTIQGKIELASSLLPVFDNFERALKAEDGDSEFYNGVKMIYQQFLKAFSDEGIEEIEAEGEEFNPEFHEAIMKVDAEGDLDKEIVIDVMQKGFMIEGRVIRPAMVRVAV
ncbi:nucleotide exchange factor GrpE [Halanaerobium hydrogeniformans]|uniref:nucleotide exchange factor GrpE n=1 Tax=Halanaerobium hydrogeniformans TaxID=656519 RepID=UPI0002DFE3BF|nr:nucleotide exchange factor GrpE [Halanaerobium hydrogeniformans]